MPKVADHPEWIEAGEAAYQEAEQRGDSVRDCWLAYAQKIVDLATAELEKEINRLEFESGPQHMSGRKALQHAPDAALVVPADCRDDDLVLSLDEDLVLSADSTDEELTVIARHLRECAYAEGYDVPESELVEVLRDRRERMRAYTEHLAHAPA